MRLRQIEIFYHVYRTSSISAAARDLNVSQPSVSKVLRHAEDQLGMDLFLRRKGRLVPTQAAHELFTEAEDIYHRLTSFNNSLENYSRWRRRHIRIGGLPSLSLSVGPDLMSRLRDEHPQLSFEFSTLHSAEVSSALVERNVDLCIGVEAPEDDRLIFDQLGEGGMVLVASNPLEPMAAGQGIDVIAGADFISMRDNGPLGALVVDGLAARGIEPNEIGTVQTNHVALSLVRKGVGVTITDQFTAYSRFGAGLHRYPLDDLPNFPIYGVALRDHPDGGLIQHAMAAGMDSIASLCAGIAGMQPARV